MSWPIRRTICGASPSEGSSINNTVGAVISARPMASICCSPPDNATPGWLPRSARMGNSRWTRLRSPPRMASIRFSRTLNVGKMPRPRGTRVAVMWGMVGANLGGGPVGNDDAVVQPRDALGDCEDHVEVMLDEHQGHVIGQGAQPRDGGLPLLA